MHDLGLARSNGPMSNVNMPMKSPNGTWYVLAIVMFALSVTICMIIMSSIQIFELQKQGHEIQRRRIRHWMAFS